MPATVFHVATATSPDQPGVEINSSQWNQGHALTLAPSGSEVFGAFSNGGNVTFGLDGGGFITANGVGGGVINQTGPNIAASNSTVTAGTVLFSNANGVTFGMNGSTMTADIASTQFQNVSVATYPNAGFVSAATIGSSSNTLNGAYLNMPQNTILYQGATNLQTMSLAAQSLTLSDGYNNFIVADRSNTNYAVMTDVELIDYNRYFPYANVYKSSNHAHIQTAPVFANKQDNLLFNRFFDTERYARESGLDVIAVDASLNITINAGKVWAMFTEYDIAAVTPATRQFFWYHVGGVWTAAASHTTPVIDNTQYDDGTGLQPLITAQFGINYLYRGIENEDHLYTILGAQSYGTLEAAMAAGLIANLPSEIVSHTMLIGRVIVQNGATTGYTYQSAFTDSFSGSTPIINHADLQGLTVGNDHPQYFLASGSTQFQPAGPYLTTAMVSNAGSNFVAALGNVTGTNITGTIYSNGLSLSVAAPGGGGGAALQGSGVYTQNTGTIQFANSNNITFGLSTNVMTASFSQSVDTGKVGVGYTSTTQGGSTVGITQNSQGLSAAWPAFVTAAGAGDGNNVLGVNANATQASTTYTLTDGNNVSFGLNLGKITASASFPAQTVDTNKAGVGFTTTTAAGILWSGTNDTNGLKFAMPAYITTYANDLTSGRAGVGTTLGTTNAGTAIAMTLNTDGLNITYPKFLTTGMASDAGSNFIAVGNSTAYQTSVLSGTFFQTANSSLLMPIGNSTAYQTSVLSGTFFQTANSSLLFPTANTTKFAGVSSGTQSTAGVVPTMTHNTAGLNLGVPAWITTYDATAGLFAAANSTNLMNTSERANYFQTASQSRLWVMGNSSATVGGTNISGTVYSNGMSLSVAAPGAGGGAAISAAGNSQNTGTVSFDNAGGVSFGLSNNGVMTAAAPAGAPSPVNFSAGTASNNLASVVFGDSNGMVFGLNTGASSRSITASYNDPDNWALYGNTAGTSASTIGTGAMYFMGGSGVTISGSSNSIRFDVNTSPDIINLLGNTAGTSSWNVTNDVIYLQGGNNITLSGNVNTVIISAGAGGAGATIAGGFTNINLMANSVTLGYGQSTSHVVPFILPNNWQWDFIRLNMLGAIIAASTTAATAANTTFSCGYSKTHNFGIYSRGAGANSDSMQLVVSTSFGESFSNNIGCGAASANGYVYSNRWTVPTASGSLGFTYDYSSTVASLNVNSAGAATGLTGLKYIDFPFATALPAGKYWLMYGNSTTTAVQAAGTTIGLRNYVTYNPAFVSQVTGYSIGTLGAATSNIYAPQKGLGSFTTAGGGTTASLHWTKVSNSAANPMLYFQLMESN